MGKAPPLEFDARTYHRPALTNDKPAQVFLFSNDWFGRRFQRVAVERCAEHGAALTIVLSEPLTSVGPVTRRRARATRPLRQVLERRARGARTWLVEDVNTESFRRRLPPHPHGVIAGFGQIFKRPTIDRFETLVNVHPSLLPYYRGANPVDWCIAHGEERSGYTVHEVTEEIDAGPVLRQGVVRIAGAEDPVGTLIDAALPAFGDWLDHITTGSRFERAAIDAASVYRVLEGYRFRAERPM